MSQPAERSFQKLVDTMTRLRRDCPWDREQTSESIMPFLIEETYEVLEALEEGSPDEVCSELGDLLLQILFHSELASERGEFDIRDVIETVREKMVRRHPHVFGDVEAASAEEVLRNWSRIKTAERRASDAAASPLDGVPSRLPALLRAERLGEKASRVGFDWADAVSVVAKVREELGELEAALAAEEPSRIEEELGDTLFALASLGRKSGISAEIALGRTLDRFRRRFSHLESRLRELGEDIHAASPERLETLWQEAKRALDPR